ncbi:monomethylamine:corrinoid methyltransferase [Methanolobus sp. ZRKC2]|uniref:monomethylamine:corrinoid methyltransferase n=1 Tax=Methanolobus sp. ZRKC2 TaxID=3125783 RepID=UPI0032430DEE
MSIYNLVEKSFEGETRTETKHEELIFETSLELIEKHDIFFNGDEIVPCDREMPNRVYAAAVELIDKTGIFLTDTNRVIKIDAETIISKSRNVRERFNYGTGTDASAITKRRVLDNKAPTIVGGPTGILVSKDLYIPIHRSFMKVNKMGIISPGMLHDPTGKMYQIPFELFSVYETMSNLKEACNLENRTGLCCMNPPIVRDIAALISISNYTIMKEGDISEVYPPGNLKTIFDEMKKAIHYGRMGINYVCTNVGIMGGPTSIHPEQFAIEMVADALMNKVVFNSSLTFDYPTYVRETSSRIKQFNASTSKDLLWASFIATMAMAQNSNCFYGKVVNNSAGPCTEMMFYETAVQTIGYTVCGIDTLSGPVGNAGAEKNHAAGHDSLFMAETADSTHNLSLEEADMICQEIFQKYESKVESPDFGKPFNECYDVNKIEPTPEYMNLYNNCMDEVQSIIAECRL